MEPTQNLASAPPPIPRQYYCPITHCVMLHPVVAPDGMSYERRAWDDLEKQTLGPLRSPITRAIMPRGRTIPNDVLRRLIEEHPSTAEELAEQRIEEDEWQPKESRNAQVIKVAKVSGGAAASVFSGTLLGVICGFSIGELTSTLDPGHLFGTDARNYERGMALAQRGAQMGAVYGMGVAARILKGQDSNRYAADRALRQLIAVYVGGLIGGLVGLTVGGFSWPLACLVTEMCHMVPFQSQRSVDAARGLGVAGVIVGVTLGLAVVTQELAGQSRRTTRRVRP